MAVSVYFLLNSFVFGPMSIAKVALLTILTWLLKAAKLAAARRGLDTGEAYSVYLLY